MTKSLDGERWQAFRAEVIELDGGVCRRCKRGPKDGAILQVHHVEYISGRRPWDYLHKQCETLCKGCHAVEHGKIPPKTGWEYLGDDDLGDLSGTCEYCGNEIRYVFFIHHPNWVTLGVGTDCCDRLTGAEHASDQRDQVKRKDRFVSSPRWKESRGILSIQQKRIAIEIRPSSAGFQILMNAKGGKKNFATIDEAKGYVFEVIESGEAEKYFQKHSKNKNPSRAT